MAAPLVVVALLVGAVGVLLSSEATLGVSIVGFACLLGITARMLQAASAHHEREAKERFEAMWRNARQQQQPS